MIFKSYQIESNETLIKEKNLFLFYGENLGFQNEIKKKVKNLKQEREIISFSQDEIIKNQNILFSEIQNISLFGQEKIFFISQANDKIFGIIKPLLEENNEQKIFLFSDLLDKKSKLRNYFEKSKYACAIPCYADNETTIRKIIFQHLKDYEGLTPQNLNLLIDNTNLDRMKLINEINKIKLYFVDKKIDYKKLDELLNSRTSDDFNILRDEAMLGNKEITNKLLSDTLIDQEKNIYYLNSINQRLGKLVEAHEISKKEGVNHENAVNRMKPPIFWKDKKNFYLQLKKLNKNKIKTIMGKTYELEIKFKLNSIINKNVLIKKLLVDICFLANS